MKMEEKTLKKASLVLGVLLAVATIINMSVTTYVYWNDRQTASMSPNAGEPLNIAIKADIGRPSPLRYFWDCLKSWTTAWSIGGVTRTDAITGITITVTGSNVASQASVDYYIEAVASDASGNPYRFLEGNGTSITVGGVSLDPSNQTTIENHLEAMGLSTTTSHTIEYYVYVKAQATGAISGETLTSEITKTLFETVTYQYGTEVTDTEYPELDTQAYSTLPDNTYDTITIMSVRGPDNNEGHIFLKFDLSGYSDLTASELKLYCASGVGGEQTYVLSSCNSFTTGVSWNTKPSAVTELYSEYTWMGTGSYRTFDTPALLGYIQDNEGGAAYLTMRASAGNDASRSFNTVEYSGTNRDPYLSLTYVSYSASWYQIPASVIEMPISQGLGALIAVACTAGLILQDNNRRKNK